jgi:hypothetical protein
MSARANNGKQGRGRNKRDHLPNYWQRPAADLSFGEENFRVTAFRPERKSADERVVSLDAYVTGLSWEDTGPILTGSMVLQKGRGKRPLAINEGHRIRLEVAPELGGRYQVVWEMRITDSGITASSGTHEYQLADELAWLQKSRDDWQFRKSKNKKGDKKTKRPNGWLAHQIAAEVCRRYGVKVGKLAKGTKRINNLTEHNASPLDIILKAYKLERQHSGRRFVVRMTAGKLEVVALRRSKSLLLLGETLIEASIQRSLRKAFATAAHVRATVKDGKKQKHKKLEVDVVADRASKRYGYIHKTIRLDDPVHSKAEARKLAKRELAKTMRPNREVTIEHSGIATLRRGDAVKLRLPELGVVEIVYVKSVSHSVSAGSYNMSVTCRFSDPYIDKKGKEIRKKRCEAARKSDRRQPDFCSGNEERPQPHRAQSRSDQARAGSGR